MNKRIFKLGMLTVSLLFTITACFTLIDPDENSGSEASSNPVIQAQAIEPDISAPVIDPATTSPLTSDLPEFTQLTHRIEAGENLSVIFDKMSLNTKDLYKITHTNDLGKQFAHLRVGKDLVAKTDTDGRLHELSYQKNAIETLVAKRQGEDFSVEINSKEVETQFANAHATIHSSLFLDGKAAGLNDNLIMQLANIFAWDIDFALNLREGDQFTVVYEKHLVDGQEIDGGEILSAEFINQGQTYTAIRFTEANGSTGYYTPEGKSLRKAFIRTPVAFARISSHFNLRRKHPVLNRIRAHKGVDYAARTGTPVKTTGNGRIVFRGRKGGYGRTIIVKHGQKYTTLYAHLSRFKKGLKTGSRVKQGQVIGYVGKSGLATGPHLHYEFRINGVHRNPLTVKLPNAQPINKSLLAEFKNQTAPLLAQLNKAKASHLLAQNQQ